MVARAVCGDHDLVLELGALGGLGDLAVLDGGAGSLEEAERGFLGGSVLGVGIHVGGVDVVAVDVLGEGDPVAVVGRLGSGPRGGGDRVVHDDGGVTVVGVDRDVTIDGEDGREALAEVLGLLRIGLVVDADVVGVHGDVAIAQVVDKRGRDDGAGELAAVFLGDGLRGVLGPRRVGHVDGAGDDAVELVDVLHLAEVDVLDLRAALEVGVVGLVVDDAVLELDELVGAGAHGLGNLGAGDGEVALREAELVVVVIVLLLVAVVMQRRNVQAKGVDHGRVDLGRGDRAGVVAGLDDAGDVVSGVAGGDADDVLVPTGEDVFDGGAGALDGDELGDVVAVGLHHLGSEVLDGLGLVGIEAPVLGGRGDVALVVVAVLAAVVDDFLGDGLRGGRRVVPEGLLLVFGPVVEVLVVGAGLDDEVREGIHAGAVLLEALDGAGVEGRGAVEGGVEDRVDAEDEVVDRDGLAVGELDALLKLDVVVDGAVLVLDDVDVGRAVVLVVLAVELVGLALDALVDDVAEAIVGIQRDLRHGAGVLVIGGLGEEGRELAGEGAVAHDKRGGAAAVAAGKHACRAHGAKRSNGAAARGQEIPAGNVAHDANSFQKRIKSSKRQNIMTLTSTKHSLV